MFDKLHLLSEIRIFSAYTHKKISHSFERCSINIYHISLSLFIFFLTLGVRGNKSRQADYVRSTNEVSSSHSISNSNCIAFKMLMEKEIHQGFYNTKKVLM